MNIFKILFGKKYEETAQPVVDDNGNNAAGPCSDEEENNAESSDEEIKSTEADKAAEADVKEDDFSVDDKETAPISDDVQNVYHLIVVDESGSMSCIKKQTVDGCNETISHIKLLQKKSEGIQKHYLSLYFSTAEVCAISGRSNR